MLHILWNLLAIIGFCVVLMVLFLAICFAAAPKDREEEDKEQINFLRKYFDRKDDNNG